MLFSEVYGAYYQAVTKLINQAVEGNLNEALATTIIQETAFSESFLYILSAIKGEDWKVITKTFDTPIKNTVRMPLTLLQKRFLKAISLDPRFRLFADSIPGLEGIEPLYLPEDFYYFDVMKDGDPFEDEDYIAHVRTILKALKEKKGLYIFFIGGKGQFHQDIYFPYKIEYSQKDDKLRVLCYSRYRPMIINVARIKRCEIAEDFSTIQKSVQDMDQKASLTLMIKDKRNAMERSLIHFSNYEKATKQTDKDEYQMTLKYHSMDETEVLIRVLAFGPMVKVIEPPHFMELVKSRLDNQKKLR